MTNALSTARGLRATIVRQASIAVLAGVLLAVGGGLPAHASPAPPVRVASIQDHIAATPQVITAPKTATLSFPTVSVTSAPPPPKIVTEAVSSQVSAPTPEPATAATSVRPAQATPQPVAAAATPLPIQRSVPAPAAAPVQATGMGATIVAAAYAQIGVHQDCTALVSNALAVAGIHFHGWPAGYKSLGHVETAAQAQPGDLLYYDNAGAGMPHIAVYIGGGMAIHGGLNGGNTAVASAYLGTGPQFIAIGH